MKKIFVAALVIAGLSTVAQAQSSNAPQQAPIGTSGIAYCWPGWQLVSSPGYIVYNVCQLQPVWTWYGWQYQNVCQQQYMYTPSGVLYCVPSQVPIAYRAPSTPSASEGEQD